LKKNILKGLNNFRFNKQIRATAFKSFLHDFSCRLFSFFVIFSAILIFTLESFSQNRFENRTISEVSITFEGKNRDVDSRDQLQIIARDALGDKYSAVKVRNAIDALYKTDRIASISVEATDAANNAVNLRFVIKRKTQVQRITININANTIGDEVTEEDILYRLNLVAPGNVISEPILQRNADLILDYLRDRGFFKSEVAFSQQPINDDTEVGVTFNVTPNAQATIENFNINIEGFDAAKVKEKLKLKPGEFFTRELLNQDVERIREALRKETFLAPDLSEPRVIFDAEKNSINIELTGKVGAKVEVIVDSEEKKVGERTQRRLLPLKREGTLDFSAIEEGRRRLENYYQEQGYFFAEVTADGVEVDEGVFDDVVQQSGRD